MQATITTNRFGFDRSQLKLAAVAIGIIGSVALGATTYSLTADDATSSSSAMPRSAVIAEPKTTSNIGFMEMNQLPEAAKVEIPNYALLDMNVLPEAPAIEHPNYALLDLNLLPGDDISMMPPVGRDGDRY